MHDLFDEHMNAFKIKYLNVKSSYNGMYPDFLNYSLKQFKQVLSKNERHINYFSKV